MAPGTFVAFVALVVPSVASYVALLMVAAYVASYVVLRVVSASVASYVVALVVSESVASNVVALVVVVRAPVEFVVRACSRKLVLFALFALQAASAGSRRVTVAWTPRAQQMAIAMALFAAAPGAPAAAAAPVFPCSGPPSHQGHL